MRDEALHIELADGARVSGLLRKPDEPSGIGLVLGHGAGADMNSPFMQAFAEGLAARGHAVLRFNFPYKELRRRAPDPKPRLERTFRAAADRMRAEPGIRRLVLGGKSMGGRIASHIAASGYACDALVFLGYPLHAAGKKASARADHLPKVKVPMLFVQGTRDTLCDLDWLRPALVPLGDRATLHIIEGGDHSFDVLKSLHRSRDEVYAGALDTIDAWLRAKLL